MLRDLPNLDWLRVFAAAAATESFVLAAARLGVTAGAVSQRIKSLEGHLGVALFQRHAQGIRLTDAGKRYAALVAGPLDQLSAATRDIIGADTSAPVRITILPALAQIWLGPRLESFHSRHENTHVEIWADAQVIDLRTSHFDLAIRYGQPPFPGCDHRPLLFDELVPIASPELLASVAIDDHGLPVGVPLNLDTYWARDFDDWLQRTGAPRPLDLKLQTFSLYSMVLEATLNKRGFMVGHTALVADLVAQGKLAYLSEQRVPAANQFYLLTRSGAPLSRSAQAFIDWIVAQ